MTERKQLSKRANNALTNHFMNAEFSPDDVAKLTSAEVSHIPNCGKVSVDEIKDWLASYGKSFADRRLPEFGPVDVNSEAEILKALKAAEDAIAAARVYIYRRSFEKQFESRVAEKSNPAATGS